MVLRGLESESTHSRIRGRRLRASGEGLIRLYAIPLKAGMSIGMMLISVELLIMLCILLFVPGDYAGACFIGFAIGESLGAAALRIAGGIFTKIADIGSDLMKIVFKIKEDDARNPGVIADCTGDNAGDSVGPSADGFETYGVTGVALISFILLAVNEKVAGPGYQVIQVQLLVWIFVMRIMMVIASGASYFINEAVAKARYGKASEMNFETPLTTLVWLTSVVSIGLTYVVSYLIIPELGWRRDSLVEALDDHLLRDARRCGNSRARQSLYLNQFGPRKRGCDVVERRRALAQHSFRPRGWKLFGLLDRGRYRRPHVDRICVQH